MTISGFWYAWGVYALSCNPDQFPDPPYALRIWYKRDSYNALLGGSTLIGTLVLNGTIHSWWVGGLVFWLLYWCDTIADWARCTGNSRASVEGTVRHQTQSEGGKAVPGAYCLDYYVSEEEKQIAKTDAARSYAGRLD